MSNVGPVKDEKTARAALKFIEDLERGTAYIPLPVAGGIAVLVGAAVRYVAIAGDVYDAAICQHYDMGQHGERVDIDVVIPGCAETMRLSGIRLTRAPAPRAPTPQEREPS